MPYLKAGRKKELITEPERAETDGDFNFLYTQAYLRAFIVNPSYGTIALIRRASIDPDNFALAEVKAIEDMFKDFTTKLTRTIARDLAFQEFYQRVGVYYEEYARIQNGDLELYLEAYNKIHEKFAVDEVK